MVQKIQKTTEVLQMQVLGKQVDGPQSKTVEKNAETPETQTIQVTQTSECLGTAPSAKRHKQ